jgi:pyruvate formate lyase activating enzyme
MPLSPEQNTTGTELQTMHTGYLPDNHRIGTHLFGTISKIQRYSTKDGPGIRTTVFCAGCNLRCIWCSNPELIPYETQILHYKSLCVRCGACAALSGGAIAIGHEGIELDRKRCTNLDECAAACNHDAFETIGKTISPEELAQKLLRDKVFYDQSGGGVTFSGGEPAMQPEFIAATAALLKQEHIHTALDTAGNVPWEILKTVTENMDLILYDIKVFDEETHRRCTGVSNALILENARRLASMNKKLHIRLILAPPFNDGNDWENRLDFVQSLGSAVSRIDLLPLHKLGAGKYHALGIHDPLEKIPECPPEAVAEAIAAAVRRGLTVTVGG